MQTYFLSHVKLKYNRYYFQLYLLKNNKNIVFGLDSWMDG